MMTNEQEFNEWLKTCPTQYGETSYDDESWVSVSFLVTDEEEVSDE
jgi:hypothetical protein